MIRREPIPSQEIAYTSLTGTCIFEIMDFFIGSVKTLRLIPKEFLIEGIEEEMSHFNDQDY